MIHPSNVAPSIQLYKVHYLFLEGFLLFSLFLCSDVPVLPRVVPFFFKCRPGSINSSVLSGRHSVMAAAVYLLLCSYD